jgi:hypothetical protein
LKPLPRVSAQLRRRRTLSAWRCVVSTTLLGILSKLPLIGRLFSGAGAGAGAGAAGARGLLRKIPLIGALVGGLSAASAIAGSEEDGGKTRRENDQSAGNAVGGVAGSVGGMMAGAKLGAMAGALGGPIGIAIGGMVGGAAGMFFGDQAGQIVGEKVGGWASDLREADIPGKVSAAWDAAVAGFGVIAPYLGKAWDSVVDGFVRVAKESGKAWGDFVDSAQSGWDSFTGLFKAAYDGLKSLPFIGTALQKAEDAAKAAATAVKETAEKAAVAAKEAIGKGVDWAAENTTAGRAVAKTVEVAKEAGSAAKAAYAEKVAPGTNPPSAEPVGMINKTAAAVGGSAGSVMSSAGAAKDWVLGQTSQKYESGKGGGGTVSTGKGDFGGASYGTYQLSSKQGEAQNFLKKSGYGKKFDGMEAGSKEFNDKWKEVAKNDSGFADAQHDYIKDTKFNPAMEGLKKSGIDLSGRGSAVQDALWSTSTQFGAGSLEKGNGAIGLFKKAMAGKDSAKMSDEEIVTAVQDYKIANNNKLFESSSANVKVGTAKRAVDEKKDLAALAGKGVAGDSEKTKGDVGEKTVIAKSTAPKDDPTQSGRYSYKDIGDNQLSVTDKETGVIELASEKQAREYRINEGKAYKDQLAQANDPSAYKPGGALSGSPSAPGLTVAPAAPVVASVKIPNISVPPAPAAPALSEAPPVITPLASFEVGKPSADNKSTDAGQDVKDRRIAHIATGGMSA